MGSGVGSLSSVRHGGGDATLSSPIPYRQGPLDYSPAVMCKCGLKTARWTSWSDDNPGRRYYTCAWRREGGCDFWSWNDLPPSSFTRFLLVDLRDTVRALKKKNSELEEELRQAYFLQEHKMEAKDQLCATMNQKGPMNDADEKVEEEDGVKKRLLSVEKQLVLYKFWFKCLFVLVLAMLMKKWF